jgi:mono/diheme cytochrome c family protein
VEIHVFPSRFLAGSAATLLSLAALASGTRAASSAPALTFEKDIRPILKTNCFQCHGEDKELKGKLDVRLRRFLMKGGKSGPAIVPGKAHDSALFDAVNSGDMPKGKKKLPAKDIATIEKWIAQGAPTARPEPETVGPEQAFTEEEREWWAFQPIKTPPVPPSKSDNPIDAFLSAKLAKNGLAFSSPANRVTLIRRATFDLIGLPPTPEEVDAFVNDKSPNAYENVIDRLLASPQYGERWGRHWLDVAGYADSDGFNEADAVRPWAWKYRDYVIKSLNDDKPFDAFVREQLAGDEMVPQPHRNLSPGAIEKITATGFLRMAADGTASSSDLATRNAVISDTLKIFGGAIYGMTIGCAQCHDHRYDPITQADYYRMRAIFEPAFDWNHWKTPSGRLVSLLTDAERAEGAKIEVEAKKVDEVRLKKQEEFITEVLEKELAKIDEKLREPARIAYRTEVKKRTAEQKKLLHDNPRIEKLSSGSLYLYDTTYQTKHAAELKKMAEEAAAVRAKKPKEEFLPVLDEAPATTVPATFIFNRGQPDQPKDAVHPSDLTVLSGQRKVELADKNSTLPTSGRRLAFAQSLTDGKHPLVARVIVNRVWMHHFGKGIVPSVADFGKLGQEPSHPEMLDWLASNFMKQQGWSMKKLHRLIMTSEAYRQVSTRDAAKERIDPDNALLGRMNVLRMEAEAMRDSMLFVSGKLLDKAGGSPIPVMLTEEGQVVLGNDTTDTAGRQTGKFIPLNGEDLRRSVYVQARRTRTLNMLETFDAPNMSECSCTERPTTTVSPQSLLLMNNGYMREYAEYFAERLQKEAPSDLKAQIDRAFRLAYGRHPSAKETARSTDFVNAQTAFYKEHPSPLEYAVGPASKANADPSVLGLAALCHALMSANEFLYVD